MAAPHAVIKLGLQAAPGFAEAWQKAAEEWLLSPAALRCLAAGIVAGALAIAWWLRIRRRTLSSSTDAPHAEQPGTPVTPVERERVEVARSDLMSWFAEQRDIAARLASEDNQILKVADPVAYAATPPRPTSRSWVAILQDKRAERSIWMWLPNLRGTSNLFCLTYEGGDRLLLRGGVAGDCGAVDARAGTASWQPKFTVSLMSSALHAHDQPPLREAFGYKGQWLAVKTDKPRVVAELLGLENLTEVEWNEGVEAAYEYDKVFLSPPVAGWTLALDATYCAFDDHESRTEDMPNRIAGWSGKLNTAVQLFVCDRRSGTYAWIRAEGGTLLRAFLGEGDNVKIDQGVPDAHEQPVSHDVDKGCPGDDYIATKGEYMVFHLAGRWSVDPRLLDELAEAPGKGLVGDIPGYR